MPTKKEKEFQKFAEDPRKSLEAIGRILMNKAFRICIPDYFEGSEMYETDLSSLTVQEMIDKMTEFLDSKPQDENYAQFLFYMTHFPVSMCKRNVSNMLRILIGFHYRLGIPSKEHSKNIDPVSMEELAEIFGRSKATIHECVTGTQESWKEFQISLKDSEVIRKKAEKELIEEEKARLRQEKEELVAPELTNIRINEGTNERTPSTERGR